MKLKAIAIAALFSASSPAFAQPTEALPYVAYAAGIRAAASGDNSTAVGATAKASGNGSSAFGSGAVATGSYSTSVGMVATASGYAGAALGNNSKAIADLSTSVGPGSFVTGYSSTAIGAGASSGNSSSAAIGHKSSTTRDFEVSVGNNDATRYVSNITAGEADTDATNVRQVRAMNADTLAAANSYTDQQIAALQPSNFQSQIDDIKSGMRDFDRKIDGAKAMASAQSNIIYNPYGGRYQVGMGVGFTGGSSALAMKFMGTSSDRKKIYSVGMSTSSHGKPSFGGGATFSFK